MSLGSV